MNCMYAYIHTCWLPGCQAARLGGLLAGHVGQVGHLFYMRNLRGWLETRPAQNTLHSLYIA